MGDVIQVARVLRTEVKYVRGKPIVVSRPTIERVSRPEDYDIEYDGNGQRYLVAREG